jgi:voltage-gated potassium channel
MGRVVGVLIMLLGIGTFALPAGILASAFAQERKRRDFIVTWNLVAQVPAFSSLDAKDIADIAALLHPREVLANEVVVHVDEEADSMYFIVRGELEAEIQPEPIRMGVGDFFGEVALIYHRKRTASVLALVHSELLELDAKDLHLLFERKPELRKHILDEAERRLANTPAEVLDKPNQRDLQ